MSGLSALIFTATATSVTDQLMKLLSSTSATASEIRQLSAKMSDETLEEFHNDLRDLCLDHPEQLLRLLNQVVTLGVFPEGSLAANLLNRAIGPETSDEREATLFMYACRSNHIDLISFMLTHGADIDASIETSEGVLNSFLYASMGRGDTATQIAAANYLIEQKCKLIPKDIETRIVSLTEIGGPDENAMAGYLRAVLSGLASTASTRTGSAGPGSDDDVTMDL